MVLLIATTFIAQGCSVERSETPSDWVPTRDLLAVMEQRLVLPEGAGALAAYARYYAGTIRNGEKVIVGVFVSGTASDNVPGSIRILARPDDLPTIHDGGCGVIDLEYKPLSTQVPVLNCHGVA
jgi:hypothetical protein